MAARNSEHDFVAEERLEDDAAMAPRGTDDAELELAASDLFDHTLRIRDGERDVNTGVQLLELRQHDRQHRAAGPRRGADLEPAGRFALGLLTELGEQLLLEREQTLRTPSARHAAPNGRRAAARAASRATGSAGSRRAA